MDDDDLAAFTDFASRSRPRLLRTAYRLCGDWHLADDLVQESFLAAYGQWSRIDREREPYPYVHQILVNTTRREHRRAWRRHEYHQEPPETASAGDDGAIEARQVVWRALARLGPQQRTIVVLRYYADLSVQQTAEFAGCSAGTVRSQSFRAIQTLRNLLTPTFEVPGRSRASQGGHERMGGHPDQTS